MTASTEPSVTFWHVANPAEKLSCVCGLVHRFFQQTRRVLITVPNNAAADYVDQLLWRHPKDAFIPHTISSTPLQAAVLITSGSQNLNEAQVLLNLCPELHALSLEIPEVHELWDETDRQKQELSERRSAAYREKGKKVVTSTWQPPF